MEFAFAIGDRVESAMKTNEHDRIVGMVLSREWFETAAGGGAWYYIRWHAGDGDLRSDLMRMAECEIAADGSESMRRMRMYRAAENVQ